MRVRGSASSWCGSKTLTLSFMCVKKMRLISDKRYIFKIKYEVKTTWASCHYKVFDDPYIPFPHYIPHTCSMILHPLGYKLYEEEWKINISWIPIFTNLNLNWERFLKDSVTTEWKLVHFVSENMEIIHLIRLIWDLGVFCVPKIKFFKMISKVYRASL